MRVAGLRRARPLSWHHPHHSIRGGQWRTPGHQPKGTVADFVAGVKSEGNCRSISDSFGGRWRTSSRRATCVDG